MFLAALDFGMLGNIEMTQSEVAKLFGVSTGSMNKHADNIRGFIVEMAEEIKNKEMGQDEPKLSGSVGTDPRITERVNWETFIKMSRLDFETFEDLQEYLNATKNEKFTPEGENEQAQVFVYDAYDAKNDEDRYEFAKKAAKLHPENVDVHLLAAEIAETDQEAERHFALAIEFGKEQFEEVEESPWGLVTNRPYMRALFAYGVWLFEKERFVNAGSIFNELLKLNLNDNQGARYLAIASFIHGEKLGRALEVLENYKEGSESDAVYLFLNWYYEADNQGESEDSGWMFDEADAANPFVEAIMDNNLPRHAYPRSLDLTPGGAEEAMFIWGLLR